MVEIATERVGDTFKEAVIYKAISNGVLDI